MSNPYFSLLSPVYNEAAQIGETIQSLQRQEFESWEIVFVDDGSSDATVEIIQKASSEDPRIRLAGHGTHIGKVAAINKAYEASRGAVLFHLAGDDTLPPGGLGVRAQAFDKDAFIAASQLKSAFFKMRTFSEDPRFDSLVLPKGDATSKTGASPTYTRALADKIFPIPEPLPSEDLWIGFLAKELAESVNDVPEVAWNYRIHQGNSNPRHKSFDKMTKSIAARARVWQELDSAADRLKLSSTARAEIARRRRIEDLRSRGKIAKLLANRDTRFVDRLAAASAANPILFKIRMRFYRLFTGLRGA